MVQDSVSEDFSFKFEDTPKTTREVINLRLSVCNDCSFREDDHCKQCGCTLSVISQVKFAKCPLDKWDSIDVNNLQVI